MDGQMVDLALTAEESKDQNSFAMPMAEAPKYPYGTSLSLDEKTLVKLGVEHADWEVGDMFHVHGMVKVVSKSANESQDGERCNVTLQFVALGAESESAEEEAAETSGEPDLKKHGYTRYGK